jgi:hypothetical protein
VLGIAGYHLQLYNRQTLDIWGTLNTGPHIGSLSAASWDPMGFEAGIKLEQKDLLSVIPRTYCRTSHWARMSSGFQQTIKTLLMLTRRPDTVWSVIERQVVLNCIMPLMYEPELLMLSRHKGAICIWEAPNTH